jgi:hypothetical protein
VVSQIKRYEGASASSYLFIRIFTPATLFFTGVAFFDTAVPDAP